MTKEHFKYLHYFELMQDMQQQHQAAKFIKTYQKQQDLSKEHAQRSPSTHSNQQILILKKSLTVEAYARLMKHQQQQ